MSVRMGMYEVCAKCGHVGRYNYVDKIFAVKASSGKEAAAKVRNFPRVKHDHKDAIRYVKSIDADRYAEIISKNILDPFFLCHNVQEQRRRCIMDKDIQYDTMVKRYREERVAGPHGKPRERIKRMSSSEILHSYYSEESKIC